MKILAIHHFFSRPALAVLCLAAGLLVDAPRAAGDETFAFLAQNPIIQGKLPAKWKVRTTTEGYFILVPSNAEDSNIYLEVDQTGVVDPKAAMEKRARGAAEVLYTGMYDAQLQDGGARKTDNGIALYSVTMRGKDGWGDDCIITATRITPPGGKSLILTFSGSPATAQAHAKELAALIDSFKPAK